MIIITLHRMAGTTSRSLDNTKPAVAGCSDQTTSAHVTMHSTTPSNVANQDELLTGEDLVAVVTTIVDRSVVKLSALKQSLHLLHHRVDHSDLMEALEAADIMEIDCKVHSGMSLNDFNILMQWLATTDKEQTRFFTRRQVGDCTDKVSISME